MILGNVPGDTFRERLATWLMGMQEPTEGSTEFNGFLSYATEAHAAILGFVLSFTFGLTGLSLVLCAALGLGWCKHVSNRKAIREMRAEPWYGIGAGFLGWTGHYWLGFELAEIVPFLF